MDAQKHRLAKFGLAVPSPLADEQQQGKEIRDLHNYRMKQISRAKSYYRVERQASHNLLLASNYDRLRLDLS